MLKHGIFLLFLILPNVLFAYDCSRFKFDVDVNVNLENKKDIPVKSSDEDMVGMLGYTSPQTSYSTPFSSVPIQVPGGYCVSLRSFDVNITQTFDITIDRNLKKDSCAYNLVLKHEQDHVNVHKDVFKSYIDNIKKTVYDAVNKVEPVFVKDLSDIDNIDFYNKIQNMDSIKKLKEDIKNKLEQENKNIDERGDTFYIWQCEDFYKEMKNKNIVID